MEVHESAEDYLEKILMLQNKSGQVRSIDIAVELGYSKPSISIAMKKLRENELIEMDGNNYITLTPRGREIAERTYDRHVTISALFTHLGVDEDTAAKDACKVEHDLSDETYKCLKEYMKKNDLM